MSTIDDQLREINQELEDMQYAEARAKELGLSDCDYSLQDATAQRKVDREREEAIIQEQLRLEQLAKDNKRFDSSNNTEEDGY